MTAAVPAGGVLQLCALVEAPRQAGPLQLEWDLVKEGDSWFSAVDAASLLSQTVHVREGAARPREPAREPLALWMLVSLLHLVVSVWWSVAGSRSCSRIWPASPS